MSYNDDNVSSFLIFIYHIAEAWSSSAPVVMGVAVITTATDPLVDLMVVVGTMIITALLATKTVTVLLVEVMVVGATVTAMVPPVG